MKIRIIQLISIALLVASCSTTKQAREVTTSGFLSNYSQLQAGKSGQVLLRYVNPNANWANYNQIIINPVAIYAGKDSDLKDVSSKDLTALANYFDADLKEALKKDYQIVTQPGPSTLQLRVAITDGDQSEPFLDLVTTITPFGLALSALRDVATGSGSFVGSAQVEAEILDSGTGERLAAVVDKRYGTKALRSKFGGSWTDAKDAIDYWSNELATKLAILKSGKNI